MDTTKLSIWTGVLLAAAAVTLAVASLLHFGVGIPLGPATLDDPFRGAAIPEAVIAVVLAVGAVAVLARLAAARWLAPATTMFAIAGTLVGLTFTVPRGEAGDILYHLGLLATLIASAVLQLVGLRSRRRASPAGPA